MSLRSGLGVLMFVASTHGLVPALRHPTPPTLASLVARTDAPVRMLYQPTPQPAIAEKAYVRRSTLVWPHVHAAWLLISAVVEFFVRLGRRRPSTRSQSYRAPPSAMMEPLPTRKHEPVFVAGTLCERVSDEANGVEFCVCQTDVDDDSHTCRRVARNGRYVWYCTQPW